MTDKAPKTKTDKPAGPVADDQDATVGTAPAKAATSDETTAKDGPKPKPR